MGARPYILAETTWQAVRGSDCDTAVLPWGATEAHNYHLPYGTDTLETEHIAAESARIAYEAGAHVMVLPAVPFGVQSGQLDIPFCLHVSPAAQTALLSDLAHTLADQGIRKLLILNGHGGNDFRAMIRELQPDLDLFLCTLNWYACVDAAAFFGEPGDHAGELETSVVMHVRPDLVLPLEQAGSGSERRFRIAALRDGWAWAPRQWSQISEDTGVGNPQHATPERGAQFVHAVVTKIAGFLTELAAADPDDLYE